MERFYPHLHNGDKIRHDWKVWAAQLLGMKPRNKCHDTHKNVLMCQRTVIQAFNSHSSVGVYNGVSDQWFSNVSPASPHRQQNNPFLQIKSYMEPKYVNKNKKHCWATLGWKLQDDSSFYPAVAPKLFKEFSRLHDIIWGFMSPLSPQTQILTWRKSWKVGEKRVLQLPSKKITL